MPGVDYLLPQDEVVTRRLPVTATSNGTNIVHGKRIFRAGTFKDSRGVVHTWTTQMLDAVVANFHHLRTNKLLADVPVRVDHTFSARDVVGWVSDLKREGEFLLADLHFTENSAFSKWDSGTYEPVSSELAPYETNNGDIYHPTLIGVAFVDIPAVEGLYRASGVETSKVTAVFVSPSVLDSKTGNVYESAQEDHMPTIASAQNTPITPRPVASVSAHNGGNVLTPTATVAEGHTTPEAPAANAGAPAEASVAAAGAEGAPEAQEPPAGAPAEVASVDAATGAPAGSTPAAGAPVGQPAEVVTVDPPAAPEVNEGEPIPVTEPRSAAVHSATQPSLMTFRVGGVPITDPELVQAHIDSLEAFQSTAVHNQRRDFVTSLVRENKILAGQQGALTELALSMDASQYEKFTASYEAAGANSLMATHGRSGEAVNPIAGGPSMEQLRDELSVHSQIIERHKMTGKPQEWIEATESYRRFTELNTQLNG